MKLNETIQLIALQLNLDPAELIKYVEEDNIGGWDLNKGGWPIGSLWGVEGQTLYALVRMLKPEKVVEIGSWRGCSSTHIATALQINDKGELTCVDIQEGSGDMLPQGLRDRVKSVVAEGAQWLADQPDNSIDLIFEDSSHSEEMCSIVAHRAKSKLTPRGVIVFHDAGHDYAWVGDGQQITSDVGATVRRGLTAALGNSYKVYRADPSDCGLAVWQKPAAPKATAHMADDGYSYEPGNALAGAIEQAKEKAKREFTTADGEQLEVIDADTPNFEEMTKAELQAYAKEQGISLSGARNIPQIIAKIVEAEAIAE